MAEQGIPKDFFDFMQKMWNPMSFPLPGMITPTVDIEEIDKKIFELKAVVTWLTMHIGPTGIAPRPRSTSNQR